MGVAGMKSLIIAATAFGVSQAFAADADHGADLARRWCAACHLVDSAQKQASADVPSFAMIAQKVARTCGGLYR